MTRRRALLIGTLAATVGTLGGAGAAWAAWAAGGTGTAGARASTMQAPTGVSVTKNGCTGNNAKVRTSVAWSNSTAAYASGTYKILASAGGGAYTEVGSGSSPLNVQLTPGTTNVVVRASAVNSLWTADSAALAVTFTCP